MRFQIERNRQLYEEARPGIAYLEAENAYTEEMTRHLAPLREEIFKEIKGRTQETDLAVPAQRGNYWYSTRTEEGRHGIEGVSGMGGGHGLGKEPEDLVVFFALEEIPKGALVPRVDPADQ